MKKIQFHNPLALSPTSTCSCLSTMTRTCGWHKPIISTIPIAVPSTGCSKHNVIHTSIVLRSIVRYQPSCSSFSIQTTCCTCWKAFSSLSFLYPVDSLPPWPSEIISSWTFRTTHLFTLWRQGQNKRTKKVRNNEVKKRLKPLLRNLNLTIYSV